MKLQECRKALKTMPIGDPRRGKIIEEMERIKKWMEREGYDNKTTSYSRGYGGGKYNGTTTALPKRTCNNCNRETHPHPIKPEMCTGCGEFYNET